MEPLFLYILRCRDRTYYVGHTDNLEKRLAEHNNKTFEGYTSRRLPVELIFHQEFYTREEAFIAEHKIKKWSRVKTPDAMM